MVTISLSLGDFNFSYCHPGTPTGEIDRVGTPGSTGNQDVDVLRASYNWNHLSVIGGVYESGPEESTVGVTLGRAAVPQTANGLPGILKDEQLYVSLSPPGLGQHTGVFGAKDDEGVTHDVHLDVAQGTHGVG
jgi:hypothetical protein